MSKSTVLTDVNGEQILPITTSENVFTGAGVTLKETLESMAGGGGSVVVDTALSESSTNPVQNKVVTAKINEVIQRIENMQVGPVNEYVTYGSGIVDKSSDNVTIEEV